jgi:hydrogenase maturation protease
VGGRNRDTPDTVVIGVGNPFRGDDGVGHRVVDGLVDRLGPVRLCWSDGEPSRLIETWAGADLAVVVDAVVTGAAPGAVLTVEAGVDELPTRSATSSHASGIGEAWALGRALGSLPRRLVIVGVEAAEVADSTELSDAVAAALPAATSAVLDAIGPGVG